MLQKLQSNNKGFTLIELMIVIAIIGILAAIAIPNFISYRDKTYCSAAETDAQTIAGAIADYFSDPAHIDIVQGDLSGLNLSNSNTFALTSPSTNTYHIVVTDGTTRCPRFDTYAIDL